MHPSITSIGVAVPEFRVSQPDIANFMKRALQLSGEDSKQIDVLYRATGIETRYSVIPDYGVDQEQYIFYPQNESLKPFPDTKKRSQIYQEKAPQLALKAIRDCLPDSFDKSQITHLITVSCTGMYAPGLDIDLVNALQLSPGIKRTCVNFMGCYAAFNALKLADAICKSEDDAVVLIVGVELCSLHFQNIASDDFLLANALFSDGAAAVLVEKNVAEHTGLVMNNFHCDILPRGANEMTWSIGNFGFEMKLSSNVPDVIKSGISTLIAKLMESVEGNPIHKYAIHPGGKKILQVIEQELGISREQNSYARSVMKNYGNMSSVTTFFVLKDILNSINSSHHAQKILALAFGPGLTLESMILEITAPS